MPREIAAPQRPFCFSALEPRKVYTTNSVRIALLSLLFVENRCSYSSGLPFRLAILQNGILVAS